MLGASIVSTFKNDAGYQVFSVSRQQRQNEKNNFTVDLTNDNELFRKLRMINPQIIVHCAAQVNVNACETEKEYCFNLHVNATNNLVNYESVRTFIYVSTDAVFDGQRGNYTESDPVNPLNYYAFTKLKGEEVVVQANKVYAIIRTNLIGFKVPLQNSLFEWTFKSLKAGVPIKGFENVLFNPFYCPVLAQRLLELLRINFVSGIYHFGSADAISKFEFLQKIAQAFNFPEALITPEKLINNAGSAVRPLNTTLNTEKIRSTGLMMPTMEQNVNLLIKDFEQSVAYGK